MTAWDAVILAAEWIIAMMSTPPDAVSLLVAALVAATLAAWRARSRRRRLFRKDSRK